MEASQSFPSFELKGSMKNWLFTTTTLFPASASCISSLATSVVGKHTTAILSPPSQIPIASSTYPRNFWASISLLVKLSDFIISATIGRIVPYFCLIPPGQSSSSVPPVMGRGTSTLMREAPPSAALATAAAASTIISWSVSGVRSLSPSFSAMRGACGVRRPARPPGPRGRTPRARRGGWLDAAGGVPVPARRRAPWGRPAWKAVAAESAEASRRAARIARRCSRCLGVAA
mmetsp:Transcript_23719/g.59533  ORF Transcript_23719/g.59533 Transcript_23719/m.59533 type:complete len:232 (+) Transcript_23719:524-1219(+)